MAIDVTSLEIQDEFGNAVTNFSLCNVGDKLTITTKITISQYAIASEDNPIVGNYTNGMIGNYWIFDPQGQFADFKIGDEIQRKNSVNNTVQNASFFIVDKLDDFHIQSNIDIITNGDLNSATTVSIFNIITPVTAIKYYWNFLENNQSNDYFSKVDGSLQLLFNNSISYSNATPVAMLFSGDKPYQIGNATVQGDGLDTNVIYGQKFKIIHNTFFTPFFLSEQWADLVSGINPNYFLNGQCLKNISKFEAFYNFNDPNRILTYESSLDVNVNNIGNTGGYNENFNTGITNYFIDSIVFTNADPVVTDTLELTTDETTIEIVIKNTVNTPFSNNNTQFTLNFIRAPFDSIEYQGNDKTLAQNFCFDMAHNTVGSASIDGDTFGTDYQVLKDVAATFISSSEILITAKVLFAANVLTEITQSDEFRYILSVAVQDHTKTSLASNCDRVTLIADINTFFVDASDPGMIVPSTLFMEHPFNDVDTETLPTVSTHVEDEVVAITRFFVDKNGRETDDIVITSIEAKIIAFNVTNSDEFTLDSYQLNMANMPIINDNQYVDLTVPRVFHIPTTEIRKNVLVKRRTDLDLGGLFYYDVTFPFMVRWENWISKSNVNGDFFNISEQNNGFNNEWFRFANSTIDDWQVYYEININATKNGTPLQYSEKIPFTIANYSSIVGDSIKTYDTTFTTELFNNVTLKKYIETSVDTGLEAIFLMDSGFTFAFCFVVFHIETFEGNGINEARRYSSINIQASDTYFRSITGNDLIDLNNPSATILRARCLIDKNLIPQSTPIYRISARLYYSEPFPEGKITEDDIMKFTEDGILKVVD